MKKWNVYVLYEFFDGEYSRVDSEISAPTASEATYIAKERAFEKYGNDGIITILGVFAA